MFPQSFPQLEQPEDFKLIFEAITPPNNPATIRAGQTPFADTAIQMRRVSIEPCGIIGAHVHPRGTEWGYMIEGVRPHFSTCMRAQQPQPPAVTMSSLALFQFSPNIMSTPLHLASQSSALPAERELMTRVT